MRHYPKDGEKYSKHIDKLLDQAGETADISAIERATTAVNSYRYTALRQYHYREWPTAGEIRDALDELDKLPLYELDELLTLAGFPTTAQYDANQAVLTRLNNGPKPVED